MSRLAVRATFLLTLIPIAALEQQQIDWERAYREVERLAPSRFPMLPEPVRRDLERRKCTVPQASPLVLDNPQPHNVARGSFTAPGRAEWAVLCSSADTTQILVYGDSGATAIDSLTRGVGHHNLQGMGEGRIAYSRIISGAPPEVIRRLHSQREEPSRVALPVPLDHDGIVDAFVGKASVVYYLHRGTWLQLPGAD